MHTFKPKKRIPFIVGSMVMIIVLILLPACGINKATKANTERKTEVGQYPQEKNTTWVASAESVCIQVQQSYINLVGHSEPIAEELQTILERIGIKAIIGEDKSCAATLSVDLTVTPIRESVSGGGYCYLQAYAEGKAQLSASGYKTLSMTLAKRPTSYNGLRIATRCPKTPADAPLKSTWVAAIAPLLNWWEAPGLVSAMQSEISYMREQASAQFGELGRSGEEAIPILTEMLADSRSELHAVAANALGSFGQAAVSAVPALIKAYEDAGSGQNKIFLLALGKIGDPRVLPVLVAELSQNPYPFEAVEALGDLGMVAAPAVPDLMLMLHNDVHQIVTESAETLGKIGGPAIQAVPELIALLRSEDIGYSFAAKDALKAITGQDFGHDADAWQKWWDAR